jgi:hypothetical protein
MRECVMLTLIFLFSPLALAQAGEPGWPQVSGSIGGDMFAFVMILLMFGAVIVMVKKADKDANIIGCRDASKTEPASELN